MRYAIMSKLAYHLPYWAWGAIPLWIREWWAGQWVLEYMNVREQSRPYDPNDWRPDW